MSCWQPVLTSSLVAEVRLHALHLCSSVLQLESDVAGATYRISRQAQLMVRRQQMHQLDFMAMAVLQCACPVYTQRS